MGIKRGRGTRRVQALVVWPSQTKVSRSEARTRAGKTETGLMIMHELLPTFEPTDADLVEQALAQPLDFKVKNAIAILQQFEGRAKKLSPYGFHLADSFGKDSGVCRKLLQLAGVEFGGWHNNTTIDAPELLRFGKAMHPDTQWSHVGKHMVLDRMPEKGNPPTRCARWCCAEYKEYGGDGKAKVIGVRIAESKRRAGIWKQVNVNKRMGLIIAPIAYWTDKDVWDFTHGESIPYSELYDEGFSRLGCIGCPLSGPSGQKREFERWPKYEKLWMMGFDRMWKQWKGRIGVRSGTERFWYKFGSPEGVYEWWRSGTADGYNNRAQCVFEEMMENV